MSTEEWDAMEKYIRSKERDFDQVGTYLISKACDSSKYPCEHTITNLRIGTTTTRNGVAIYEILKNWRLSHPHFEQYSLQNKNNAELIALSNSLV